MAIDAYAEFKRVYNQGVADGLPTAVATAAAQSAMDDALRQQATVPPVVQSFVAVSGSRLPDPGPKHPAKRFDGSSSGSADAFDDD